MFQLGSVSTGTTRQCRAQILTNVPPTSAMPRQCKRRATVGEVFCFQHGGGRCECPENENHSGSCQGPYCNCH